MFSEALLMTLPLAMVAATVLLLSPCLLLIPGFLDHVSDLAGREARPVADLILSFCYERPQCHRSGAVASPAAEF